ncbi:MarR family winged helix-turn-helix transcriptional regulator [Actinocorallia populi]|uniref:MarR family winged helix-turn-helix transcriptional regulator n=1 Tax=Actinocorallia populi TaxID=2079200 RepID=UPI000D09574D|nr:MarR family transcriptional regulator [Actinocorallia populi]
MNHARVEAPNGDDIEAVTTALLTASRLLVAISARSLGAVGEGVTLAQFRMLTSLSVQGPMKLSTLADLLGVNPSTALRMAERLVLARLITRKVNPQNRREIILGLAPAGRRVVADVTARRRDEISQVVARLAPDQRTSLVQALAAFTEAGGDLPATVTQPIFFT